MNDGGNLHADAKQVAPTAGSRQYSAEYYACRDSLAFLLERHYVIQDKTGRIRLMQPLKLAQRKLLAALSMCRKKKIPAWIIIGKARKQGISTLFAGAVLAEVIERGIEAIVIAHNRESAEYILGIYHRFYEYLDRPIDDDIPVLEKPPLYKGQTNKYEIRFGGGHSGRVEIDTANNTDAGRGRTPQIIHGSECAFWDKGNVTAVSLFQSMGRLPGTSFVMESTFNAEDPLFLPTWMAANDNAHLEFSQHSGELSCELIVSNPAAWNGWIPLFISVLDDEDARENFPDETSQNRFVDSLSTYERMLMQRHNAPAEYLNWRRLQIKMTCQGDEDIYNTQYPNTWEESLEVSRKRARFDNKKLALHPIEQGRLGNLFFSNSWDKKVLWQPDPKGRLIVFRHPQTNHFYVVGIDSSEGKLDAHGKEQDESVIDVYDRTTGMEQVAKLYGMINEEELVSPACMIGHYFNDAFIVPESNSTAKHLCIELGKRYPPQLLYHRDDWDSAKRRSSHEVGHRTHVGNKSIIIGNLAEAINNNEIIFHCEKSIRELKAYEYKEGGGTAARSGYHDDHVVSAALAVTGAKSYYPMAQQSQPQNQQLLMYQMYPKRQARIDTRDNITGY